MEIEGVVEEVEQTPAQIAAAFSAGFDDDEQTPPPVVEEKPEAKEPEVKEPVEPEPKLAQITEAQLADLMAKAGQVDESRRQIDTLSGHIGNMKQVVEGLKQQRKQLSPGQLKRVAADFPELAQALQDDISELAGSPVDADEISRRVTIAFETKLLRAYHPDWKAVANSPEFHTWKAGLPTESRAELENSNDAEYLADRISEFKTMKAKADADAKAEAEAKANRQPATTTRQKRLEAAVPAKGTGAHATSKAPKSDFQAGWDET